MKTKFLAVFCLFFCKNVIAQNQDGNWDFIRAIERNIPLADGEKKWYRIELPVGTTQIIYRVSFLSSSADATDKLASTLQSAPSLTAKGASAALNLITILGGTNKGRYHIFTSSEAANAYLSTGKPYNSCYSSGEDIPGEKNFLNLERGTCITQNTRYLWFAFYNGNYAYDEEVLLEVVPWVDNEASKGWTLDIKNAFMKHCVDQVGDAITMKKEVCACVLEKFQKEHKVHELTTLTEAELEKISLTYSEQCIKGTGEHVNILDNSRETANQAAEKGDYTTAIQTYLEIIESGSATVIDYNNLGWYYILTKQYLKATKYLKEGEKLDETELLIKGNLAHAYLLSGEVENAKTIYLKFKTQNVDETLSWCQMVKDDFETLRSKGITCEQFSEILNLLK